MLLAVRPPCSGKINGVDGACNVSMTFSITAWEVRGTGYGSIGARNAQGVPQAA